MINCKHSFKIKKISSAKDKDFSHLQQIYEKEFAPITSYKVNQDGLFDQDFLISTWSKHGYEIYLLEIKEEAVGFAVVNLASMIDLDTNTRDKALVNCL
jgi:predicted acetyltransferase